MGACLPCVTCLLRLHAAPHAQHECRTTKVLALHFRFHAGDQLQIVSRGNDACAYDEWAQLFGSLHDLAYKGWMERGSRRQIKDRALLTDDPWVR